MTPVPNTDLILVTRDLGSKSRLEAIEFFPVRGVWQSDKIKGDVLQLAVDPENDLIALILVKNPRSHAAIILSENRPFTFFKCHPAMSFGNGILTAISR